MFGKKQWVYAHTAEEAFQKLPKFGEPYGSEVGLTVSRVEIIDSERGFWAWVFGKPALWTARVWYSDSGSVDGDPVNHPEHYTSGSIECIDAIRAALTEEEFRGYCKGNALKYVWRERHKGGDESLAKADWYLKCLTEEVNP